MSDNRNLPQILVTAAQLAGSDNVKRNVESIADMSAQAAQAGSDMIVFPEAVMFDFTQPGDVIAETAREYADYFEHSLKEIAQRNQIAIVAGMYGKAEGNLSTNTVIVIDASGAQIARYDKLHNYDAFNFCESSKHRLVELQPEFAELSLFTIKGIRFGVINCYDLRFPEMARALIDKGADMLVVSSGWVAGPLKESQWTTLLKARALENTCFVVASCQPAPGSAGLSMVVDPLGIPIAAVPECAGLATALVSMTRQNQVREILPCVSQRRYAVVQNHHSPLAVAQRGDARHE